MIQVVCALTPLSAWQSSRNGDVGRGRMMKQPMSSMGRGDHGPPGRARVRVTGLRRHDWPMMASGPISSSIVRSAEVKVRNRGLASPARVEGERGQLSVDAVPGERGLGRLDEAAGDPALVPDSLTERGEQSVVIRPVLAGHLAHLRGTGSSMISAATAG